MVHTSKYEIIESGCCFIEDDYAEFILEDLFFRLYINYGPEENSNETNPYVNYQAEDIEGKRIMIIRAYNYNKSTLTTLTGPIHLANIKGKKLLFRFSSIAIKGDNNRRDYMINYVWFYEKTSAQQNNVAL